ncbi:unnamed protein product [Psylliodes chrysocephalus]|uniref:Uncharacterized protein n=1 Tax=Psylliodes chrysocephalus TaxID=3402493 RepID=A0A9P0CRI7_9CUCU|nr:unnamed protein product [Psylliodes chrysocephala]
MADINCILCSEKEGETSKFVKLSAKSRQGIISASKIRKDNIHELFEPFPDDPVRVHFECRRVYTNPKNIQNDAKLKLSTQDEAQVNDLPAADAIYHQACSVNFRKGDLIPKKYQDNSKDELRYKPLGRPMEKDKLDPFLEVCKWFKENDEPVCAQQLVTKMKDFLPVDAAIQHLLRVHLQCLYWKTMNINISNPEEWGWKKVGDQLQPIICEMSPAPELLLNTIRCTCKTDTNEPCGSGRCTCRGYGVECTEICCNYSGRDCTNSASKERVENNEEDY